ncbi:MAG: TauD/TfdA family dioxygenase [Fuerstiella sp.]|nr:TauD/TfdA family dioxygenase [Fuerstiella sp.]
MKSQTPEFKRLTPHCGAEVQGINLSQPLDERATDILTTALAEYCVLFFRDQQLTPEQHKAMGRCFGELHFHPAWPRLLEGHPEIMEIFVDKNTKRIAGEDWHSDVSCGPEPPLGTILHMLETPPSGGDTLFASMYAAFDRLSAPMQQFLEGLSAVHDGEHVYRGGYGDVQPESETYPRAEHPVVRTHPVSGRKALFVNRTFTTRIVELPRQESDAVLQLLFRQVEQPEIQCRFHWRPGSVAFWDNRCSQHHALWDYYPNRRRGLRVTIRGEAPFWRPESG